MIIVLSLLRRSEPLLKHIIKKTSFPKLKRRIFTGDPGQIRTADLSLRSTVLFRKLFISYLPVLFLRKLCCLKAGQFAQNSMKYAALQRSFKCHISKGVSFMSTNEKEIPQSRTYIENDITSILGSAAAQPITC